MKVYEWTLEEIQDGDIVDSDFSDSLIPYKEYLGNDNYDIGLVLNEGNGVDGLQNREWAYIKNGKLPEYFYNGSNEKTQNKIPAKFHKELSNL